MPIIAFTKVRLPFGWLGNMSPHAIVYDDCNWRTAEALFQALRFDDLEIRQEILQNRSPMGAKMVAKKHSDKMKVIPRSAQDLANMELVVCLKLKQHPDLQEQLMETNGITIIEDCTKRANESGLFWGAALIDGEWKGQNMLGKIWMKIRDG